MSAASHLPVDPDDWPDDPFELLGVEYTASPRDLRQAYTRLIRCYKPEHAAREFQKIREAYESACEYAKQWQHDVLSPSQAADAGSGEAPGRHPDRATRSLEREIDDLWTRAQHDGLADTYRRYRELVVEMPGNEELCLRLYWMLAVAPDLAPREPRCAWLAEALRRSGLSGRAWELYRRELAAHPAEAGSGRCAGLLQCDAPAPRLVELAAQRWQATGGEDRAARIAADLRTLRPRAEHNDHAAWIDLLLTAIGWLAWTRTPEAAKLMADCRREAEASSTVHRELEEQFVRCDHLMELVEVCRKLRIAGRTPKELVKLLQECWNRPFDQIRPALLAYLRPMVEKPGRALRELDEIGRPGPAVLHYLGELIARLHRERVDPEDIPDRTAVFDAILDFLGECDWNCSRLELLDFCLAEKLSVQQFGEIVVVDVPEQHVLNPDFTEWVLEDVALHCLCMACQAFWA